MMHLENPIRDIIPTFPLYIMSNAYRVSYFSRSPPYLYISCFSSLTCHEKIVIFEIHAVTHIRKRFLAFT